MRSPLIVIAGAALIAFTAPADADWRDPGNPRSGLLARASPSQAAAGTNPLDGFDYARLHTDRAYAQDMLATLDAALQSASDDPEVEAVMQGLRAAVLGALDRAPEAGVAVDRVVALGRPGKEAYGLAWLAAADMGDLARMVNLLEAMARNVPAADRGQLLALMPLTVVNMLEHSLRSEGRTADRRRLAEALIAMDWPDPLDRASADYFRRQLVDQRLEQRDLDSARQMAASVTSPSTLLSLLVHRKYDLAVAARGDASAAFTSALGAHDRATAAALAAQPQNHRFALSRAQHLRSVGREQDALAVLMPFTADLAATAAADPQGIWLVNEAAYALLALGRRSEAVSLMSRLVAMDMAANPELIGPSINHSVVLWRAGRFDEALAHAQRLDREAQQYANDYGRMWIASSVVCSLASLDRGAEAAPWLRRMQAQADSNAAALTRAYLCLGDMDAAEALLVRRLESAEPESALLALQRYAVAVPGDEVERLYSRLEQLRDRPAVRQAVDRVGRILNLPLSRIYWGDL